MVARLVNLVVALRVALVVAASPVVGLLVVSS